MVVTAREEVVGNPASRRRSMAYLELANPQLVVVGCEENINFELLAIFADVGGAPEVVPHAIGA